MTDDIALEDLHQLPWSLIQGAYVRVLQEVDDRDPLDPAQDDRKDLVHTEEREGELVGRANGWGLYYDSGRHETIRDSIGPAIYLDTPEETTLEVLTDRLENELLAFDPDVDERQVCPECGRPAATIVDVQAVGDDGYGPVDGVVHEERLGEGYGGGWRLYCHASGFEDGDSA